MVFGLDGTGNEDESRSTHIQRWQGHNDGALALFLQRGPSGLRAGAGHKLFIDGRLNSVRTWVLR